MLNVLLVGIIIFGIFFALAAFVHYSAVMEALREEGILGAVGFVLAAMIHWLLGIFFD